MSPPRTLCLDIVSPAPGDREVISQVERLSSSETKIAKIGADSGLLKSGLDGHRLVSSVSGFSTLILPESGPLSTRIGSVVLVAGHLKSGERVLVYLPQLTCISTA